MSIKLSSYLIVEGKIDARMKNFLIQHSVSFGDQFSLCPILYIVPDISGAGILFFATGTLINLLGSDSRFSSGCNATTTFHLRPHVDVHNLLGSLLWGYSYFQFTTVNPRAILRFDIPCGDYRLKGKLDRTRHAHFVISFTN